MYPEWRVLDVQKNASMLEEFVKSNWVQVARAVYRAWNGQTKLKRMTKTYRWIQVRFWHENFGHFCAHHCYSPWDYPLEIVQGSKEKSLDSEEAKKWEPKIEWWCYVRMAHEWHHKHIGTDQIYFGRKPEWSHLISGTFYGMEHTLFCCFRDATCSGVGNTRHVSPCWNASSIHGGLAQSTPPWPSPTLAPWGALPPWAGVSLPNALPSPLGGSRRDASWSDCSARFSLRTIFFPPHGAARCLFANRFPWGFVTGMEREGRGTRAFPSRKRSRGSKRHSRFRVTFYAGSSH